MILKYIQLALVTLVFFCLAKLAPFLMLLLVSILLAVALDPLMRKMQKSAPKWVALSVLILASLSVCAIFVLFIWPPLSTQTYNVAMKFPSFMDRLQKLIPVQLPHYNLKIDEMMPQLLVAGGWIFEALSGIIMIFILTLYLLVDGDRALNWIQTYLNPEQKIKMNQTCTQVSGVVSAYILGQAITSVCASVFVYILLSALHVPAAMMLAVLAGIFDILPIVGFPLFLLPTAVFSLTVTPTTALIAVLGCIGYHFFENYLLVPKVYGERLRLSGLAVIIGLIVSGILGGVLGALLILPLIASYPLVEKIWFPQIRKA